MQILQGREEWEYSLPSLALRVAWLSIIQIALDSCTAHTIVGAVRRVIPPPRLRDSSSLGHGYVKMCARGGDKDDNDEENGISYLAMCIGQIIMD